MLVSLRSPARLLALGLVAVVVLDACHDGGPFEVYGPTNATFSLAVGQNIDIHMQTVGPGDFGSPPMLGGSSIEFLGVGPAPGPPNPGGEVQVFHFKGVAGGTTIITFQRVNQFMPGTVVDTVTVR